MENETTNLRLVFLDEQDLDLLAEPWYREDRFAPVYLRLDLDSGEATVSLNEGRGTIYWELDQPLSPARANELLRRCESDLATMLEHADSDQRDNPWGPFENARSRIRGRVKDITEGFTDYFLAEWFVTESGCDHVANELYHAGATEEAAREMVEDIEADPGDGVRVFGVQELVADLLENARERLAEEARLRARDEEATAHDGESHE
jgi:hypothetical protein